MTSRPFPALATAVLLLAAVVVFFPSLFYDRVISPLDAVFSEPPWRAGHHPVEVANPALREPATSLLPDVAVLRRDGPASALWSPYAACGGPGSIAWDRGTLSPFVLPLVPWIDWARLCNALILAKLACAFVGVYLLLRRLARSAVGATTGAIAYALSGPLAARWLWPVSGAAAMLPVLLWGLDRAVSSPRPARAVVASSLAWLAFLACGHPSAALVGTAVALVWAGARARRVAKTTLPRLAPVVAGLALAVGILTPSLGLFAISPGPEPAPEISTSDGTWGWSILRLLVDPFAFGDPRLDSFEPPPSAVGLAFHDSCVAVGIVTAALAALGLAARRPPWTLAGLAAAPLVVLAWAPAFRLASSLPGLSSDVWALAPVSTLALAALAACGVDRLAALAPGVRMTGLLVWLPVAIALQQGLTAGHLLSFLPAEEARWSRPEGLRRLQMRTATAPARVAPLQEVLWPDSAAAYGLEDVRSGRGAGDAYRRWLQAVDPQVWGHFGPSLRLNAATVDLGHPYLRALGARWVLEPPQLRLVEYVLSQRTTEVEPRSQLLGPLRAGDVVVQELTLSRTCRRLAVHSATRGTSPKGFLSARLLDEVTGSQVGACRLSAERLATEGSAWIDLPRPPVAGHRHRLELVSGVSAGPLWLRTTSSPDHLDGRLTVGGRVIRRDLGLSFDVSGYSVAYDGPDLRIWENQAAAPRFWPVRSVVEGDLADLLALQPPLDLARHAMVPAGPASSVAAALAGAVPAGRERVVLESWGPSSWVLALDLAAPALLVSSLPAQPRIWRAHVDGVARELIPVNGLFLGLVVPEGRHRVRLQVALPSVWYGCSLMAGLLLVVLGAVGWRRHPTHRDLPHLDRGADR